ncbi:hypothetical protein ACWIGI_37495 [Nocardia sp. NPDC055321]
MNRHLRRWSIQTVCVASISGSAALYPDAVADQKVLDPALTYPDVGVVGVKTCVEESLSVDGVVHVQFDEVTTAAVPEVI